MELDLLERCRAHDRSAFSGLVALWGGSAAAVVVAGGIGKTAALPVVADAFGACWRQLPSLHSERPFRPWLLHQVASIAIDHGASSESIRGVATSTTPRRVERAVASLLASTPAVPLPSRFVEDMVAPRLVDTEITSLRRVIRTDAARVWSIMRNGSLPWPPAGRARWRPDGPLQPGSHALARGTLPGRRQSRDSALVVTVDDAARSVTWTTRSALRYLPGSIEFRWVATVEGDGEACEVRHRLLGIAFPAGTRGRFLHAALDRVGSAMTASMHRGLEALAAVAEAAAPR